MTVAILLNSLMEYQLVTCFMQMIWQSYHYYVIGLQNSLNRIYTYCNKGKIEVSTVRTKTIVNTSDKLLKGCGFHYYGKIVGQVREFRYFMCKRKAQKTGLQIILSFA